MKKAINTTKDVQKTFANNGKQVHVLSKYMQMKKYIQLQQ